MKAYLWIILGMLLIGSASAVTLDDTFINLTSANTGINVTQPWTFTNLTVGARSFLIYDLNQTNALGTFDFNFSQTSKQYRGTDFPYVISSTSSSVAIRSNITQAQNVTFSFTYGGECSFAGNIIYNNGLINRTIPEANYTCSGGAITVSLRNLRQGTNTLFIDVQDEAQNFLREQCLQSAKVGADSFSFLPLAFVALLVIAIIGVLVMYGMKKDSAMSVKDSMPGLIQDTQKIAIGIGAILMIILLGAAIISSIATLYCG